MTKKTNLSPDTDTKQELPVRNPPLLSTGAPLDENLPVRNPPLLSPNPPRVEKRQEQTGETGETGETAETAATQQPAATVAEQRQYRPNLGWNDSPFRPHSFQIRPQLLRKPNAFILITPEAFRKMLLYVEIAGKEVGWLGTVTKLENDGFLITDTFLLEQEVTAAETELSSEGQNKLVEELLELPDGFDKVNQLRFWGHSHVRMGTSPSSTDESTMLRFMDEGQEWYIRGIFNKLGRAEFTVYFYDRGLALCDVPWHVVDQNTGSDLTPKRGFASGYGSGYGYQEYNRWGTRDRFEAPAAATKPAEAETYDWRTARYASILPPQLQPSDELREQIVAEFQAKVSDKVYGFGFLNAWLAPEPEPVAAPTAATTDPNDPAQTAAAGKEEQTVVPRRDQHPPAPVDDYQPYDTGHSPKRRFSLWRFLWFIFTGKQ